LTGKTAVVTGGASGIGRGIALRLARDGADLAICDLSFPAAEAVAEEVVSFGRRAVAAQVDVANSASVQSALLLVHEALGPVHVLVNSAGICTFVPFAQMEEAAWDRMIAVHLKGAFNTCKAFLPDMVTAGWGRIVNIASVAGLNGGGPGLAHYASAKAGIVGLTKALALELGPLGITANVIAPGMIDTPLIRQAGTPPEIIAQSAQRSPVRRIGNPDDIAAACAYLVADEASFFTGQVLSPNGGGYL
jgi:NAD(P)-dependent dehydrogenase (short-subunit alcohol dehydrogenase family)